MRYLKLSISLVLSAIGFLVYFVTVPKVNQDEFVDFTVQAGEESVLEDYDFNGYLYHYSAFSLTNEDIFVPGNLPYLEKLDALQDIEMMLLREDYPDFINSLAYNPSTHTFLLSNDEDYLTAAHFDYRDGSFSETYSELKIKMLNKETNEIAEESIIREVKNHIYYSSIVGVYVNYPEVKVAIDTRIGDPVNEYNETSELSFISYNIETKNVNEKVLLETDEYLDTLIYTNVQGNKSLQVFQSHDSETSAVKQHLVDYAKEEMVGLEGDVTYIVSDDSRLYGIKDSTLIEYSATGEEVVSEVELSTDFAEKKNMDFSSNQLIILDGKLFVINNNDSYNQSPKEEVTPTDLVVYELASGNISSEVQFTYDGLDQVDAWYASIDGILKNTSKD